MRLGLLPTDTATEQVELAKELVRLVKLGLPPQASMDQSRLVKSLCEHCVKLTMAEGGQKELFVGHDVLMSVLPNSITWADVARLCEWRFFHAQACALTCAPRCCPQQENTKCSTKRGFCWRCSGGLLLPDRCALGWDDNILAQWAGTDNEHAVLLTYPPDASDFRWERPNEGPWEIPHLCGAKFEGPRIVRNCRAKAALNLDGPTLSASSSLKTVGFLRTTWP